ncbi:keratin-associated protein 6-2-like [Hermetia illucens]|uniref:keratin-associated protein 6-2-like n=1 Tax=Hermetia illucens TaxID=343691 RepID=UPI0018CC106E|nr:keratin-associated protein 6-2-like [Hermetia illucens]
MASGGGNGKEELSELLPGDVVTPAGYSRGTDTNRNPGFGAGMGYGTGSGMGSGMGCGMGRGFSMGRFPMSSFGQDFGANMLGHSSGMGSGSFENGFDDNPYDDRNACVGRGWCPGAGMGLPGCSVKDAYTGGHFKLIDCPGDECKQNY